MHRFNRQQRKQIKHRDQRSLVDYARMMKRSKVKPSRENIPVGTHLLLSGILVTVNGVVLDIGLPGWLTERLPKDSDKTIRSRLKRNALSISKNRPGKLSILSTGWWLKRRRKKVQICLHWNGLLGLLLTRTSNDGAKENNEPQQANYVKIESNTCVRFEPLKRECSNAYNCE